MVILLLLHFIGVYAEFYLRTEALSINNCTTLKENSVLRKQLFYNKNTLLEKNNHYITSTEMKNLLSLNDPSSFSNPDEAVVQQISIKFLIDFDKKIIVGEAKLSVRKVREDAKSIVLDTSQLNVKKIMDSSGNKLDYNMGIHLDIFGSRLEVMLPLDTSELDIIVQYETDSKASALDWLAPEQTLGGNHPYLFSQCQPIHARSIVPCQDSPSVKMPYTAQVTAPAELTVLMSALNKGATEPIDGCRTHNFSQPVPVPSYLIALVVGHISSQEIGPRSRVWAEPEILDKAAYEFAETEQFLKVAESICGPYVWGVYDLLLLPPSFPFGGMENPCLTFVTPTLLAGDRSLSCVVAHEIAHSWTGNLITNRNFNHFWLNEGFTMYVERKILGRLYGELMRNFAAINGLKDLRYAVDTLGDKNPLTKLVVDLSGGISPDDAFSNCPYEKGHTFLFFLEQLVGGPDIFEPFLRAYLEKYKFMSIETEQFKKFFQDYFINNDACKEVDWDAWLLTPGMPYKLPKYDTSLADACTALATKWIQWEETQPVPFASSDITNLHPLQVQDFLSQLLEIKNMTLFKVETMEKVYSFSSTNNSEIKFRWLRLCLKVRWEEKVSLALTFVTEQGRMKFVRPIYRDLYAWEEMRQRTINHYIANCSCMMWVTAHNVAKDLHLE